MHLHEPLTANRQMKINHVPGVSDASEHRQLTCTARFQPT
jgi:hypothetical protein